jgi:hypothetical protein
MSRVRIILAFLVAPLMTPLVLLGADQLHGAQFNLPEQFGAFIFVGGFAYAATLLFGLPVFFLFRTKSWTNVFLYVLVAGLIGLLVSLILNYPISSDVVNWEYRGWHATAGGLSGLVFRMFSKAKFDHLSRARAHGET